MVRDGNEEPAGTSCPSRPSGKKSAGGKAARERGSGKQGPHAGARFPLSKEVKGITYTFYR